LRNHLGAPADVLLVGSIARLIPGKNHNFMLDVLAVDGERGGNMHLVVIGDGHLRPDLEVRARSLGIQHRVHFLGVRHDVPELLHGLDVVILPSLYEGLPLNLVEAQASGTPAVVSDRITREVDLGLGLVRFLSLDSAAEWREVLCESLPQTPGPQVIRRTFLERGYDSSEAARRTAHLFGVDADQRIDPPGSQ
jgi:glycosyltransferase EpsF